ncbi:MAG: 16S rRNA (uracil(1498)-N(3))-methyltransferase [Gottschalkiaceae bacterium]|nr:MAG: 16S rRNA (uracil(1498)-N(3))-methyltransferase [Gottschalkiaceae bacterium]
MHRFFIDNDNIKKGGIIITDENVNHISRVLRLKERDKIILCDGKGTDYIVSIDSMDKYAVRTTILYNEPSVGESNLDMVVYQGIPKSSKMDFIIQKCTELGVNRIVPVINTRTVVKLATEKEELMKVERWQRIAKEAAKQSGRGKIPVIDMPMTFENAINEAVSKDLVLMPYELEKNNTLKEVIRGKNPNSVGIFIGPEGGFESDEVQFALCKNVITVTLGNRILRTETAGLVILSCIMYEFNQI